MATESPNSVRKIVVHLRATGGASILKQSKFKIAGTEKFAKVIDFLRRQLHSDSLFVYVNSAFSPNPDESVIDLYNIAGTEKFAKVIDFLRRQLHSDSLFVYVNSAFSPNPDESVIDLYNNFGFDGKLVVNYACSMAWG